MFGSHINFPFQYSLFKFHFAKTFLLFLPDYEHKDRRFLITLFPLALINLPIPNLSLFAVNLSFVALLAIAYAACIQWGKRQYSFELWEVVSLLGIYLVYLGVMIFGVLPASS